MTKAFYFGILLLILVAMLREFGILLMLVGTALFAYRMLFDFFYAELFYSLPSLLLAIVVFVVGLVLFLEAEENKTEEKK